MRALRIAVWWQLEQWVGHVWQRHVETDGVSAGRVLDWATAFTYGRRKRAERA